MKKTGIIVSIAGLLGICSCAVIGQAQQSARVSSTEPMEYPYSADLVHVRGAVVIRASLDETGKIVSASAITGDDLLTSGALSNIRKWRFKPNAGREAIIVYAFRIRDDDPCENGKVTSNFEFEPPNLAVVTACGLPLQPQSTEKR